MSTTYDCRTHPEAGVVEAVEALRRGELVIAPNDTVHGIALDAVNPSAVGRLLEAKGRGRDRPTAVLVPSARNLDGIVDTVPQAARDLVDAFWPGALTLVLRQALTLAWDLGDTKGPVAVRMALDAVALAVLEQTGPLAVSSVNRSGLPPATDGAEAARQLGTAVELDLNGGVCGELVPSTLVDLIGEVPRVLGLGELSVEEPRSFVPSLRGSE